MKLIDSENKRLHTDIEKIKQQIAAIQERGYLGRYGNFLPYTEKKANEMLPKLKEAGVNCELKKLDKKGYAKIIFLDLPE